MVSTSIGIIDNLAHLCTAVGHVPNGMRAYYVRRSQPPLLSEMVAAVLPYHKSKRVAALLNPLNAIS